MPLALTLPEASFTNPVILAPPVYASEDVYAYFGRTAEKSVNLSPGNPAFTDIGTGPSIQSNYAAFTPFTAAVRTGAQMDSTGKTVCIVAKAVFPIPSGALRYRIFTPDNGVGFYFRFFATTPTTLEIGDGVIAATNLHVDTSAWAFYAGAIGDSAASAVYDFTNDTSATGDSGDLSTSFPNAVLDINSGSASGTFIDGIDVAFAGIWSANLTEEQITPIYAAVKSSLALRGIYV